MVLSLFILLPALVGLLLLLMKQQKPFVWLGAVLSGFLLALMTFLFYRG